MAAPLDSCLSGKDNTADIHSNTKETFKDPLTSALDKDSEDEVSFLVGLFCCMSMYEEKFYYNSIHI